MSVRRVWLVGGVCGVLVGIVAIVPLVLYPSDLVALLSLVVALPGFVLTAIVVGFSVRRSRVRPFWKGLLLWLVVTAFGILMAILTWWSYIFLWHWIHYGTL